MAIVFNKVAPLIAPVYGPVIYDFYDSSYGSYVSAPANFMMRIEYVDGITAFNPAIYIRQKPAPYSYNCQFNISAILQGIVNSKVYTHTEFCKYYYNPGYTGSGPDLTTLDKPITRYGLDFYSLDASGNTLNHSGTYQISGTPRYALYGTNNNLNGSFDASSYLLNGDVSANFLTSWTTAREVHSNDTAFMQFVSFYDTTDASVPWHMNQLRVSKYTSETATPDVSLFDVSTRTQLDGHIWGDAYVVSLSVGPKSLNVDSDKYQFYTIQDSSGYSKEYRYNFVEDDTRFDKYYRIYWVNSLGATECLNFDLATQNNINISKQPYLNNSLTSVYVTEVQDIYTLTTNWMCDSTSLAIKDLWYSPKVSLQICEYGVDTPFDPSALIPVVITDTSKQILNRRNSQLINYTISFIPATEFFTLKS